MSDYERLIVADYILQTHLKNLRRCSSDDKAKSSCGFLEEIVQFKLWSSELPGTELVSHHLS